MSELRYEESTDTSVNITWKPPKEPNGLTRAYFVEHGVYETELAVNVTIHAGRPTHTIIRALSKLLPFHMKYIPRHNYVLYPTRVYLSASSDKISLKTNTYKPGHLKNLINLP